MMRILLISSRQLFWILLMSISTYSCKTTQHSSLKLKRKHLIGFYVTNTAEGYRRPQPDTEIIPDIPYYIKLELLRNGQFKRTDLQTMITSQGRWKLKTDSLYITYTNGYQQSMAIDQTYGVNQLSLVTTGLYHYYYVRQYGKKRKGNTKKIIIP